MSNTPLLAITLLVDRGNKIMRKEGYTYGQNI